MTPEERSDKYEDAAPRGEGDSWPAVSIKLDALGRGEVCVNGERLRKVIGVSFVSKPNAVAQVTITMLSDDVQIEAPADVHLERTVTP